MENLSHRVVRFFVPNGRKRLFDGQWAAPSRPSRRPASRWALRTARSGTHETQHRAFPWQYPRLRRLVLDRPACSSGRGGRPGSHCGEELREPRPEARRSSCGCVRPRTSSLAMSSRRHREPGRWRFPDRAGRASWFRVDAEDEPRSAVTYRRARYRSGASRLGIAGAGRRRLGPITCYAAGGRARSADDGSSARESAAFFAKTGAMTAVSTLQRLTLQHARMPWSHRPGTLGSIRHRRTRAPPRVSLDGVMVPLRPGTVAPTVCSILGESCGRSVHDAEGVAPEDPLSRRGERQAHRR